MLAPIKRALISVSDKTGLADLSAFLLTQDIEVISTGGTAATLREAGVTVIDISEYTGFPEIMDGRVKTLHPKVHGGLLAKLDNDKHKEAMEIHDIASIDLVIVNLYPFEETLAQGAPIDTCIENIDIGGPSMIRSSAKNHAFTTVIVDPADYPSLIEEMQNNQGGTSSEFRRNMAAKAFMRTASYDVAISNWFKKQCNNSLPDTLQISLPLKSELRYGENPHQRAGLYVSRDIAQGITAADQVQGKPLSYNNICDSDAAWQLVSEFDIPTAAIIKHANPCGVASGNDLVSAYRAALACDPVSAFGGIIALNQPLDIDTAIEISNLFVEVIIAPSADDKALALLAKKTNLRILLTHELTPTNNPMPLLKSIAGGLLVQDTDQRLVSQDELQVVTHTIPDQETIDALLCAFKVAKHVRSNAIVISHGLATIGLGAGQMSRVDAVRFAILKAQDHQKDKLTGAVLASDAFFPFADSVELAAKAGIKAIIQPGGSKRDQEVIDAANQHQIAMVFTGSRHFKH